MWFWLCLNDSLWITEFFLDLLFARGLCSPEDTRTLFQAEQFFQLLRSVTHLLVISDLILPKSVNRGSYVLSHPLSPTVPPINTDVFLQIWFDWMIPCWEPCFFPDIKYLMIYLTCLSTLLPSCLGPCNFKCILLNPYLKSSYPCLLTSLDLKSLVLVLHCLCF